MLPTGEAREGDPITPGGVREWQSWRRDGLRGMEQKVLHKTGSGGEHLSRAHVPSRTKRTK